jgi:predicted HicB family RNase H-like nuclease
MYKDFDGFSIHLFYEEKTSDWGAYFIEKPAVSAFGKTPDEALQELKISWDAMKESYLKNEEPVPIAPSRKNYSGSLNVRVGKRLHKALAIEAAQTDVSLNALISQKLAQCTEGSHSI